MVQVCDDVVSKIAISVEVGGPTVWVTPDVVDQTAAEKLEGLVALQ